MSWIGAGGGSGWTERWVGWVDGWWGVSKKFSVSVGLICRHGRCIFRNIVLKSLLPQKRKRRKVVVDLSTRLTSCR